MLLDGGLQGVFADAFSGLYLDGTLTLVSYADDGAGDLTQSGISEPVKLQVDEVTERQKIEEGYTSRDVRILILQRGVSDRPKPGSQVSAKGVVYSVGPIITEDPAATYWQIRGTPL